MTGCPPALLSFFYFGRIIMLPGGDSERRRHLYSKSLFATPLAIRIACFSAALQCGYMRYSNICVAHIRATVPHGGNVLEIYETTAETFRFGNVSTLRRDCTGAGVQPPIRTRAEAAILTSYFEARFNLC